MGPERRLEAYTWHELRSLFAVLWVGMTLLFGTVYGLIAAKNRSVELEAGLKVAGYTVGASLKAQDWDLALGHLRVAAASRGLFDIELLTKNGTQVAGPLGDIPLGFGRTCEQTIDEDLAIRGCTRVLTQSDCYALSLLLLSSLGFFLIAFRSLKARVHGLVGGVSQELVRIRAKAGLQAIDLGSNDERPKIAEIAWVREQVETLIREVEESARDAAFGRVASSVSHDVRGSLNSLDFLLATLPEIPEKKRAAIQAALKRLKDIVDDLRDKANDRKSGFSVTSIQPLLPVVEKILADKRLEYRNRNSVTFEMETDSAAPYAAVSDVGLFRILSNLIDNAVEAIPGNGMVRVEVRSADRFVKILVTDNGVGIPPDLISKLGTRGVTHGKDNGTGLGLHFSRSRVESWGGHLTISSTTGVGTRVEVRLPRLPRPKWLVEAIELPKGAPVVVVDDDPLILAMWKTRLSGMDQPVSTHFFQTESDFRTWHSTTSNAEGALYLVDYELTREGTSGLDLIEQSGIASASILVTGRAADPDIVQRCEALGVRLLSKDRVAETTIAN